MMRPILIGLALVAFLVAGYATARAAVPGDTWTTNSGALPADIYGIHILTFNNQLVSIAGQNTFKVYSSTDMVTWSEEGSDVFPRQLTFYGAATATLTGSETMVVTGGISGSASNEVYSSTNVTTWTAYNNVLPDTIYQHCTLAFNDQLWVIGGFNGTSALDEVYASTYLTDWTQTGTLPETRRLHACAVFDGQMWVIGGLDGAVPSDVVYSSYDGITWSQVGTIPSALSSMRASAYDGKLYVVGGLDPDVLVRTVYASDNGADWLEVGDDALPVATRDFGMSLFLGHIVVAGGRITGGAAVDDVFYTDSVVGNITQPTPIPASTDQLIVGSTTDQSADAADANLPLGWLFTDAASNSSFPIRFFYILIAMVVTVGVGIGLAWLSPQNLFLSAFGCIVMALIWMQVGQGIIPFWANLSIAMWTLAGSMIGREVFN